MELVQLAAPAIIAIVCGFALAVMADHQPRRFAKSRRVYRTYRR